MKNWIIGIVIVVIALGAGVGTAYGANRLLGAPTTINKVTRYSQRQFLRHDGRRFFGQPGGRGWFGEPGMRPGDQQQQQPYFPWDGRQYPRRLNPSDPNQNNPQIPGPGDQNGPAFPGW